MSGRLLSRIAEVALAIGVSGSVVFAVQRSAGEHQSLAPQIAAAIEQAVLGSRGAEAQAIHDDLRALYSAAPEALVWFDASGKPRDAARTALNLLARSAEEGLRPADYLSPGYRAARHGPAARGRRARVARCDPQLGDAAIHARVAVRPG